MTHTRPTDSSSLYEAIVETASDVIMTFDEEGKIVTCNGAVRKMFGYLPSEVIGGGLGLILPEQYRLDHEKRFRDYLARGEAEFLGPGRRIEAKKMDGTIIPVSFTVSLLNFQNRRYFSIVFRDIGKILNAEKELEKMARELARSNSHLEEFAALAAHDLQAPLRTVRMLIERLSAQNRGEREEGSDDLLRRIQASSRRMQTLIDDLLELCRIRKSHSILKEIDANVVFDEAAADLLAAISDSGGGVSRGALPRLVADEGQIRQLLQNLISNAMKFRRPGIAPEVRVSAVEGRSHWEFCVEDNGIGIEAKNFGRIFQPFQRLHGRNEYPGNGIGLAICKEIVERHGGELRVESEKDKGSKFYFTIAKKEP